MDGRLKFEFEVKDSEVSGNFPDLPKKLCEELYDRLLSPILFAVIPEGLVLVNCGRFRSIDEERGSLSHRLNPDFLVCHPTMVERQTISEPIEGIYCGALCDFRLRDGLGGVMDCKLHVNDDAFEELLIHLQHLCHQQPEVTHHGVLFGLNTKEEPI